jgi:hypothetical protein
MANKSLLWVVSHSVMAGAFITSAKASFPAVRRISGNVRDRRRRFVRFHDSSAPTPRGRVVPVTGFSDQESAKNAS